MRRRIYHRWILVSQTLIILGLGVAMLWNVVSLLLDLDGPNWWLVAGLPLPGLVGWLTILAAPAILSKLTSSQGRWYRLTYDTPAGWQDDRARTALLNLLRSGAGLEMIWANERDGLGCWLAVSDQDEVLQRLVTNVFPAGSLEADQPPQPGKGAVMLRWKNKVEKNIPSPVELGQLAGIDGVYFRWRSDRTATVVLWGPEAEQVARQYARSGDLQLGQGPSLLRPAFVGDNPWPDWPPFPPSQHNPGLAAVSELEIMAPALRINGTETALRLGMDSEQNPVGFGFPRLTGLQPLQIFGQAAETVTIDLACQAIQAGRPILFLDGRGAAAAHLARPRAGF
jgi:hypothetical protein